jgi:uncharacterized protein (TIGR02246 family)
MRAATHGVFPLLLIAGSLPAQSSNPTCFVRGVVAGRRGPMGGANIFDVETVGGAITGPDGTFAIDAIAGPIHTAEQPVRAVWMGFPACVRHVGSLRFHACSHTPPRTSLVHNALRTPLLATLLFASLPNALHRAGAGRRHNAPASVGMRPAPPSAERAQGGARAAAPPDQSVDERAVRAVLEDWLDALRHNDMAALERTIAPDYTITVSAGRVLNRDEDLEVIKSGKVHFHSVDVDSIKVKMLGTAAMVTGIGRYTVTIDDKTSAIRERFTVVFAKRDRRWQPVASHTTPLRAAGAAPASSELPAKADSAAIAVARAALAAGNAEYIRAFGSSDAAGVAAVYAPDGSRMGQKGAVLTGRAAIRDDTADLAEKISGLGLQVDRIVPVHGQIGTMDDLRQSLARRDEVRGTAPANAQRTPRPTQGSGQTAEEKAVRAVLHDWLDALLHNDMVALERIIAPDYTITAGGGRVMNREEDLEVVKSGKVHFQSADVDSVNVRMFGEAAIVTGLGRYTVTMGDKTSTVRERFTDIYAKREGRWQPVASHTTPLRN